MARTLYLILVIAIVGTVCCAPTENDAAPSTETHEHAASGHEQNGHETHSEHGEPSKKGKSFSFSGNFIKLPFEIGKGAVSMAANISKTAITASEKLTVGIVETVLTPVKYVGEKIGAAMSHKWQEVHLQGLPTDTKEYSYVVRILIGKDESKKLCGGVLIDSKHVLTAAHCVDNIEDPGELYILAGNSKRFSSSSKQIVQVVGIEKRASYNPETLTFDLALLELEKSLKLNEGVSVATLPENSNYDAENINEGKGIALGTCSKTKQLVYADVRMMQLEECAKYFDVYYNQMCVTNAKVEGIGSCTAESGFPLIQKVDNKHILVGIASYTGEDCKTTPSVYSRVSKHLTWIKKLLLK